MGGGGAERQLTYAVTGLRELGWEAHVALRSGGANLARLEANGAVIHRLSGRSNYDPRLGRQLWRLVGAVGPSLIQTWLPQMDVFGGVAARAHGVPWILTERASRLAYPPGWRRWLRGLVATRVAAVVANSEAGAAYWEGALRQSVPCYVIPNAVPVDEIDQAPTLPARELGTDRATRVILYAGRFEPPKNLETLLPALARVLAVTPAVAVLCGEGPDRAMVERRVRELGLGGRVLLPGYVADLWSWMKRATVFVSVSTSEGRPNAVLEAMAAGCPLVVSDIPAHREFLDEESAVLVDPRLPASVAAGVLRVLANAADAARRAARARATVEKWAVPAIAREYDRVYEEVLARHGRSGRRGG
jgi:glycosyltransferase involved in cell wall biosynthesis